MKIRILKIKKVKSINPPWLKIKKGKIKTPNKNNKQWNS